MEEAAADSKTIPQRMLQRSSRLAAMLGQRRSQLHKVDATPPYVMERCGTVMVPEKGNPLEEEGVLNPASARGADGSIYLFPRMVAAGNFSRIGRVRVHVDGSGVPIGVERLGVAVQAEHSWEVRGVEDPRISWLPRLRLWIMTYTAVGPLGPRIAIASSEDLITWKKLGLATFVSEPTLGVDFNGYHNKDALVVPNPVTAPDGTLCYAIIHRPMWDMSWTAGSSGTVLPEGTTDSREAMWVSYAPAREVERDARRLTVMFQHRPLALPEYPWEEVKIGGGTPPVSVPEGWLILHHGISRRSPDFPGDRGLTYSAGAMILDRKHVERVLARSRTPLLVPERKGETEGIVGHVVFPTAIEPHANGKDSYTVFYGMADSQIGAAILRREPAAPQTDGSPGSLIPGMPLSG